MAINLIRADSYLWPLTRSMCIALIYMPSIGLQKNHDAAAVLNFLNSRTSKIYARKTPNQFGPIHALVICAN